MCATSERGFAKRFSIAGRPIGPGMPPYVVAEMSANHLGAFERAVRIVEEAARAGADAVKLQTYRPESLTIDAATPPFCIRETQWAGRTLFELYRQAATPWQWYPLLKPVAERLGIALFSTPFDVAAVEFLEKHGAAALKIASFEIAEQPLLQRAAQCGKPLIVSTGMASQQEIHEALGAIGRAGGRQVALLHCTSAYPAAAEAMHLRTLSDMHERFGVPVGLSDHSLSDAVPVAAVALGACIVEKHLTLSRADGGPDAAFSLEPGEFARMVHSVRTAWKALGEVRYGPTEQERPLCGFRRSLFAVRDVEAGETFTAENVRSIRPAGGLHPRWLPHVLGRKAACFVARGTPLGWEHVEGPSPSRCRPQETDAA